MPKGLDMLKEHLVEPLSNAIQLQHFMHYEPLHRACCRKVFIKFLAKVFASVVQTQHLDPGAVLLSDRPHLKELVGFEGLAFLVHQVDKCKTSCIVCEYDEVVAATLGRSF